MTKEKEYTLQEAKNMLLQLAGEGVLFDKHPNPEYLMAYKKIKGWRRKLVFRAVPEVIPKWYDQEHFWRTYEDPEFNEIYKWTDT